MMTPIKDAHEKTLQERSDIPPADPAQPHAPTAQEAIREEKRGGRAWWIIPLIVLIFIVLSFIALGNLYAA